MISTPSGMQSVVADDSVVSRLRSLSQSGAALVIALSCVVLTGWALNIPVLSSVVPGLGRMSVLGASCFLLGALSLLLRLTLPQSRQLTRISAAALCLIGAYVLGVYIFTSEFGVELDTSTAYPFGPYFGRMAPATAFAFMLAGLALSLDKGRAAGRLFAIIAGVGLIIPGLDLVAYIYSVETLYQVMTISAMSLPTTMGFALLFCALLLSRPMEGWTERLFANDSGGIVARRLMMPVLGIPLVLGWAIKEGVIRGAFEAQFGIALLVVATIAVLQIIVIRISARLSQRDRELREEMALRRQAQDKLHLQVARLNLLHQITSAIGDRLDLKSIFQIVIRSLEDQLPVDFASFALYDAARHVVVVENVGVKSKPLARTLAMLEEAVVPVDQNGLSRCVKGELVYEPDIGGSEFPFPMRIASAGLRALVISPLIVEGKVFGVLMIARMQAESFSSSDCEFMKQLSGHVALAVHQTQLHKSLKQAYDDLRRTQQAVMQQERLRALGQMASGIAHDINNAISPVALYTESLLETEPGLSPRTRSYLESVQRVVNDVAATVARMREFYRQRDDATALTPVDLNELIRQTLDLTRARWSDMPQRRGIVIRVDEQLHPTLPHIMGIDSEIREALTNLIFNAVDAMPGGGTITIRTVTAEATIAGGQDRIKFEISDTGVGMDDGTRRRCLEPFFTTKGERGSGLGLAMVYGTLQRHDAAIEIDSQLGRGTTFRILFQKALSAPAERARRSAGPLTPMRILLIDDDPFILDSMRVVLEMDGHAATLADGGAEGIGEFEKAHASKRPFDVVFTDLGMPHTDGRQVAHAIKTLSPATPIILLTGWGQRLGKHDRSKDVDYVLAKPPQLGQLRETLEACAARLKDETVPRPASSGA